VQATAAWFAKPMSGGGNIEVTGTTHDKPSRSVALNLPSAWDVIDTNDHTRSQSLEVDISVPVAGKDRFKLNLRATLRDNFDLRASDILSQREHVPI